MNMWDFLHQHPFIAWCLAWSVWGIYGIAILALRLVNRCLRTVMVVFRGWPPPHLDADGDFKPTAKETDT